MSKRAEVMLTHKPSAEQVYQVVVKLDSIYPEVAADECRKQAVTAMQEMVEGLVHIEPSETPTD